MDTNINPLLGTLAASGALMYGANRYATYRRRHGLPAYRKTLLTSAALAPFLAQTALDVGLGRQLRRYPGFKGLYTPDSGASSTPNRRSYEMRAMKAYLLGDQDTRSLVDKAIAAGDTSPLFHMHLEKAPVLRQWSQAVAQNPALSIKLRELYNKLVGLRKSGSYSMAAPIPLDYTRFHVLDDPNLMLSEKASLVNILDKSDPATRHGLVTSHDIARGALGAGIGYASASLLGKTVGALFGELPESTLNKAKKTGIVAGLLRGTGIWTH